MTRQKNLNKIGKFNEDTVEKRLYSPNKRIHKHSENFNPNSTLIQILNDIRDPNKSIHHHDGHSIYLPLNTNDLDDELRQAEAGYLEEDDEDLISSELSGGLFGMDEEPIKHKKTIDYNSDDNEHNLTLNKSKAEDTQTQMLESHHDLEHILFPKSHYDINQHKTYSIMTQKIEDGFEVIAEDFFLVVLNYLYSELHNGLLELGDNFTEERRKHFNKNFDTYLTVVNFYLKAKEEFFLGVLSQIMSKLNITQEVLDHTFDYYVNIAEDSKKVAEIREAYNKVYKAGEKYSIAPKIITKLRLKSILEFQLQTFEDYSQKYPQLSQDALEVVVTDKMYIEYGFDKEAVKAAISKHQVYDDSLFEEIIGKLSEFKNTSFLNI